MLISGAHLPNRFHASRNGEVDCTEDVKTIHNGQKQGDDQQEYHDAEAGACANQVTEGTSICMLNIVEQQAGRDDPPGIPSSPQLAQQNKRV